MKQTKKLVSLMGAVAAGKWLNEQVRLPVGVSREWLEIDGISRSFLLYIPAAVYENNRPAPLVVNLHGYGSWPTSQIRITGWNDLADQEGFVVAYPAATGVPKRWHTNVAAAGAVDDLAFLAAVMEQVAQRVAIDRSRVYLSGMSNGGGMVNAMARLRPAGIAAIGTVAGAYVAPAGDAPAAYPIPLVAFHGTADRVVPYEGGAVYERGGWIFPAVEAWAADWAERNGCAAQPTVTAITEHVTETRYADCAGDNEVVLYTIANGGHSWPKPGKTLRLYTVDPMLEAMDTTAVMWEFFARHALPERV